MGSFLSIQNQMPNGGQLVENPDDTPCKLKHKRLLSLDPRSPSESINRTPIVVDKTPVTATVQARQSAPNPGLIDPRSPTTEFTRTPLQMGRPSPAGADSLLSGASQSLSPSSNKSAYSESGIESAEVTPLSRKNVSVPIMTLDSDEENMDDGDELQDIEVADGADKKTDVQTSSQLIFFDSLKPKDTSPLLVKNDIEELEKNTKDLGRMSLLPILKKRKQDQGNCESKIVGKNYVMKEKCPKSLGAPVVRSPLTCVANSRPKQQQTPKHLMTSSNLNKPSPLRTSTATDKENVCH